MRLTKRCPKKPEKSRFPSRKGDGPGRKFHSPTGNAPPDDKKQRSDRHGNRTADDRIAGRTPQTDRQDNRPDNLPKCGCAETTGGTSPSRETTRPSLSGCRRNYFSAPAFFGSAFTLSEAKPSTIFASSFFDAS